jgi:hypothetical protein
MHHMAADVKIIGFFGTPAQPQMAHICTRIAIWPTNLAEPAWHLSACCAVPGSANSTACRPQVASWVGHCTMALQAGHLGPVPAILVMVKLVTVVAVKAATAAHLAPVGLHWGLHKVASRAH